jgi:hypothetical protein
VLTVQERTATMKIIPNQRFRHDGQTYETDQEYDVPNELGQYFTNVGWVGNDRGIIADRSHGMSAADLGLPVKGKESEVKLG